MKPMPAVDRVGDRVDDDFWPSIRSWPAVGLINAAENFHQRGFARAVFARKRDDFARIDLEVNAVERNDSGEAFADSLHFQNWTVMR